MPLVHLCLEKQGRAKTNDGKVRLCKCDCGSFDLKQHYVVFTP